MRLPASMGLLTNLDKLYLANNDALEADPVLGDLIVPAGYSREGAQAVVALYRQGDPPSQ